MCLQSCKGSATYLVALTIQTENPIISPGGAGGLSTHPAVGRIQSCAAGVFGNPGTARNPGGHPCKRVHTPCCLHPPHHGGQLSDSSPS